jgi:N-acetylglutamate synthase-like GNAT family acetyltransferase
MKRSAMQIRLTKPGDIAQLQIVLDETGVFPREMLPDMIRSFFSGDSQEFWMTCEADGVPVGFCYTVPEEMAEGTWNMLAIGVRQSLQGGGHGSSLVRELEALTLERPADPNRRYLQLGRLCASKGVLSQERLCGRGTHP